MAHAELLRIYLDPAALARARAGTHNFFGRVAGAVRAAGWRVEFVESTLANRLAAPGRDGYALFHMEPPTHDRALTCRRVYVGAFWSIEAQAERWLRPVAQARFLPGSVAPDLARGFAQSWRGRLFPGVVARDHGYLFMPLQGRLLDRRGFQAASPVEMIEAVIARDPRPVRAALHPQESYTPEEIRVLAALSAKHARFNVQRGGGAGLLRNCQALVTENSAMALEGYFLEKPALLFARIDFHHIAASVPRDGLQKAFDDFAQQAGAQQPGPGLSADGQNPAPPADFAAYLHWFLQQNAINAGRPECEAQVLAALRAQGWPLTAA